MNTSEIDQEKIIKNRRVLVSFISILIISLLVLLIAIYWGKYGSRGAGNYIVLSSSSLLSILSVVMIAFGAQNKF